MPMENFSMRSESRLEGEKSSIGIYFSDRVIRFHVEIKYENRSSGMNRYNFPSVYRRSKLLLSSCCH